MKAKEKAKELVFRFGKIDHINNRCLPFKQAKQCALIAVDEIIEAIGAFGYIYSSYDDFQTGELKTVEEQNPADYWQEVKQEIEKYESK